MGAVASERFDALEDRLIIRAFIKLLQPRKQRWQRGIRQCFKLRSACGALPAQQYFEVFCITVVVRIVVENQLTTDQRCVGTVRVIFGQCRQ